MARTYTLLLVILFFLVSGCSQKKPAFVVSPGEDVELTDVPFFPQQQYQCGPAALASLLVSSDVVTLPELLTPSLYLPKRKGSLQLEMIGSIRRHNRIPYVIRPELGAIVQELKAARPVLVLQNVGLRILPGYHYAVVIGMTENNKFILRSGTTERLVMGMGKFEKTWLKAGGWGVVALKAHELPADHDLIRYLEAVAGVEATGKTDLARQCYTTVLQKHPYNQVALFGLANSLYAQQQYRTAATLYSHLVRQDPSHIAAVNNLAETLSCLHCYSQALELLDTFL